jgi:hypothetical protein
MPNYTDAETKLINSYKKKTDELPTYYYAVTKVDTPISRDFESYLILESKEHKQKTLSWIGNVQSITKNTVDRDALAKTYLENRRTDAVTTFNEIDASIKNFNEYKKGLFNVGDTHNFAEVLEVSLLAQSLQRPLEEIVFARDRAFHEQIMTNIQISRIKRNAVTTDTQKELSSWQTVVNAYPGQSDSPTNSNQQSTGTSGADPSAILPEKG